MERMAAQVALYMLSVTLRIFERAGGRMKKVNGASLSAASAKVNAQPESIFCERWVLGTGQGRRPGAAPHPR